VELDGKSVSNYFQKYKAVQNKYLINYKLLKEKINEIILT